ncbi:ASCH domain-containing protein [Natronosalvus vescus]|uniref:ASCH domain-containing protein n=1 Tax=Natronosalvus vescus TaxID=2953881 RepID=UPI0020900D65|nr:ASCH domain-containing protein [Natronosalvus vescus]
MTELDPDTLLPSPRMRTQALEGEVSQIHRGHAYAEEGDTFTVEGEQFEVTSITERRLGDLTDEDAKKEGVPDLEAYRKLLERAHDDFEWHDESEIVRHRFERVSDSTGD